MRLPPLLLAATIVGCTPAPEAMKEPTSSAKEGVPPRSRITEPPPAPVAQTPPAGGYQRLYALKDLARSTVQVNGKKIRVWVADDDGKRTEGMMGLTDQDVKQDEGMLFVFPAPRPLSFWMQNTILPLDIIYIDPKGTVLNVQQGKPFDETGLPSDGPGKYVLELKKGGAKRFGVAKGTKIDIPKNVTAKN